LGLHQRRSSIGDPWLESLQEAKEEALPPFLLGVPNGFRTRSVRSTDEGAAVTP
jgi:hypothetical protein